MATVTAHILVKGRVQKIGFRRFVTFAAEDFAVSGSVRNESDGDVYIEAFGDREVIEKFIEAVRKGNGFSVIERIDVKWKEGGHPTGEFKVEEEHFW